MGLEHAKLSRFIICHQGYVAVDMVPNRLPKRNCRGSWVLTSQLCAALCTIEWCRPDGNVI
jgi:hypothetical protein